MQRNRRLLPHASSIAAGDAATDDTLFTGNAPRTEDGTDTLLEEMKECRTVNDIVEVIQDEAASMSAAEVALGLYRLGYLSKNASRKGTETTYQHNFRVVVSFTHACLRALECRP